MNQYSPSCSRCAMQNLCFVHGLHANDLNRLDQLLDHKLSFRKGDVLFNAGDTAQSVYAIRSGLIKLYSTQGEQELIHDFYLLGDLVGLEGLANRQHHYTAKVIEDVQVCAVSFDQLDFISQEIPELNTQLLRLMSQNIVKERQHARVLTHKTAEQKMAEFLIEMIEKLRSRGYDYLQFRLGILHRDVANFLNLTPETISRVLAKFNREGLLSWKKKEVKVMNLTKLYAYSQLTQPHLD